ncbi:uncharacterized protein LOC143174327 isoform X2 [Nomia melanderi]|uniref:uncharacterized protein LOC143174327 isoform X2 n=1 Tax=Nomia melanderi TaxID=2448451 RepID=UPI003FCDA211
MEKSVDIFKSQYFNLCRLVLLLTGLWPYQNQIAARTQRIVVFTMIIAFLDSEICAVISGRHDMQLLIETIPPLLSCIGIIIKYLNCSMKIKKMKQLMDRIRYDWQCAVLNKEDHIFEFHARQVRKINMTYSILPSVVIVYFIVQMVPEVINKLTSRKVTRSMHQPFHVEFFVDEDEYFVYIFTFINVSVLTVLAIVLAVDTELNMIINHACTMFAVIGYRSENAFRYLEEDCKNEKINEVLISTVKYHKDTIKFVEGINSYCSGSYLLTCGIVIVLFSILLVHVCIAIKAYNSLDLVAIPILNFIGHMVVVYFNTIMAQRMKDVSSDVFHQTYCGEWYTAPITAQKMLLVIMGKCLEPATIMFTNVFTVSMEKFASVLKTSMSHFMVLYSLQ